MALICRAHRAGSVASSSVIQVPVVFDSNRARGGCRVSRERISSNSGRTGSIELEWNPCEVRIRRADNPFSARRSSKSAMRSSGPDTKQLPGSLIAAMSRPGESNSAVSSGLSATATIAPRGAACISRARADTALIAVGRSNTPAQVAATYSPMLCPAKAAGRTP